jgi:glycosyltransferase involved in cell wall biosynthesis
MKKRILMVSESSHIKSGFGNYTREVLSRLHATGKYEIAELSCYRTAETPKTEPWKIYPVAVSAHDPSFSEFTSNPNNNYGQWRFEFALLDFKPHIVFDIRDFWNYTFQEISPLREYYHWIINPTYDSSPLKIDSVNTLTNADLVLFHTEWAKQDLINTYHYSHNNLGPIANDAVDSNVFKPIGYTKKFHKIKYNIKPDAFVIGSVMRNQKRKLIPDLIKTFSKLLKNHPKAILYLHTSYPDSLGWDIPSLLLEHNVANNVLLTYKCKNCQNFTPSVFKGIKKICKVCKSKTSEIWSMANPISETELNEVYNLFDVYVQYAICEGFGIPAVEAAAVGLPVISINFGAMGDVGSKIGASLVDVKRIFREQETNADRCYPDNDQCLDMLQRYINMPMAELNSIGKNTRKKLLQTYSWDQTTKIYEQVFDSIDINQKRSWNSPPKNIDTSYQIINRNNNRDFIYDIVDNVIKEPDLKRTSFIETIIKSLDDETILEGLKVVRFSKETAVKLLEVYANNKQAMETIRVQNLALPPKLLSFIEYSKK